jgi:hypothetical protein
MLSLPGQKPARVYSLRPREGGVRQLLANGALLEARSPTVHRRPSVKRNGARGQGLTLTGGRAFGRERGSRQRGPRRLTNALISETPARPRDRQDSLGNLRL